MALTHTLAEDGSELDHAAWEIVKTRDAGKEAYALALRQAEAGVRLVPGNGYILNTLGVAQYRTRRYAEALATLMQSEKLNATKDGSHPADLAFLAMAQHQLGKKDDAETTLGRLREVMKQPAWANYAEAQGFLREAEELIEGKGAGDSPAMPEASVRPLTLPMRPASWKMSSGLLIRGAGHYCCFAVLF